VVIVRMTKIKKGKKKNMGNNLKGGRGSEWKVQRNGGTTTIGVGQAYGVSLWGHRVAPISRAGTGETEG